MRDEIMPGKDMAAYWIEHVLRHGGTKHLQSRANELPFYQLYLLDIWFVLIAIPIMFLSVTIKFLHLHGRM
jgi:glucuronosyltransferase